MKTPALISPQEAAERIRNGSVLVDIREAEERDTLIPEALHVPLSTLDANRIDASKVVPVIFHCRTGRRTSMYASRLCEATDAEQVYLLDGGIDNWMACGLPTTTEPA